MVAALANGGPHNRIGGGWQALAKLLFFCSGCESTQHFQLSRPIPGHFVNESRFSKTSGQSFLSKKCKGDLLYVSDPCEHGRGLDRVDDLGMFRGVFQGFIKSKTRACLVARQVVLEALLRCPYCGARVWSMTTARLVPKSAAKRLGSYGDKLEFFLCVNGHMFGSCWLIPLSSDEGEMDGEDDDGSRSDGDDDGDEGSGPSGYGGTNGYGFGFDDPTARNGGVSNGWIWPAA